MKGNIDLELLSLEALRLKVKEVRYEYGQKDDDKLKNFIDNNKYNPIIELTELTDRMLKKYLKNEDKKDFYDMDENWKSQKGKLFLENIEIKYSISALDNQIADFLVTEYFSIRKKKSNNEIK